MSCKTKVFICALLGGMCLTTINARAQLNVQSSYALIKRVIPGNAQKFIVQPLPAEDAKDVFEVEGAKGKIILRGNNGVAVASALYYYLTEYTHCQVTWNGTNLNLPVSLPMPAKKIRKATPYQYRYYLNYCTYSYSMSWWDWKRWEKEIDWMALHGINMPLAITGQEYVWDKVYKSMGFSNKDMQDFFTGPAYFGWFYMGNIDQWDGPLPASWINSHKDLQVKILQRERELGIKPVLPAFTGHVPASFKTHFPNAKLKQTNWKNGFADTYILDSEDPLFAEIGKKFIQEQTKVYGTDHLYSADTFNENEPPSNDPKFLSELSARIYDGMKNADPKAVWVMQGWLFFSDRKFWQNEQIKALLNAVPNEHMIVLDLNTDYEPVWKRTEAFYGKPWIWNMLHNYGGNNSLFGRIEAVAAQPAQALNDPKSGRLVGIGLTMEAIEQTPVLYELMTQNTWQNKPVNLDEWLPAYLLNRYGVKSKNAVDAWQTLRTTVFNGKDIRDGAESIITGRPTLDSAAVWTRTHLNYNRKYLLPAWDKMVAAIPACKQSSGFNYDLVDVTRQVLANYGRPLQLKWVKAYRDKDLKAFEQYSNDYINLITDMDRLLATQKDFMLGPWIADARKWGTTPAEKALYEKNARNLITLWGDADSPLHEYSCRQWSGLLNDFYKVRWQKFFTLLKGSIETGKEPDFKLFDKSISGWEWQWVNSSKAYPVMPTGSSTTVARQLYEKYRTAMAKDLE
ncbi:alpha-N-acetylglucosaminidase [Mucilaginibacter rubeus]|uniref:Alpha-N-acetylglucosaminidase n=1 Tax=Mucilaginibacter rubeus TaxID=2027860 RepID=A0A5C1I7H8_9SPHI|nr:alpha-N-acetylglucosaminidase [Mucilaginibacter rubeus]QEM14212.1 alpha-N-acetylglucosaminidase [Mucilaginibacter rubeus]